MTLLAICAFLAVFGAVQTLRIGDLNAKLRMPELPLKAKPRARKRRKRR